MLDSFDDVERLERVAGASAALRQAVLIRVTPGVAGRTHAAISTGQADSKFGFGIDDARVAIERLRGCERLELQGLHMHIGSQLLSLDAYRPAVEAIATLGDFPVYNLGGGLGVAYTAEQHPPSIEQYVDVQVRAAHELLGPRQAAADRAGPLARRERVRDALHGRDRQAQRLDLGRRRRRHVGQPAPDALRLRLRGAASPTAPTRPAPASAATSPASTASRAT